MSPAAAKRTMEIADAILVLPDPAVIERAIAAAVETGERARRDCHARVENILAELRRNAVAVTSVIEEYFAK